MFFVLSKVVGWLVYPLSVCFFLGVLIAIFYRRRAMRWLLVAMVLCLYGASARVVAEWLVGCLEGPYQAPVALQHYDVAIVLTGMVRLDIQRPDYIEFNGHVDRILAGISLVKRGVADKLLITGGSGLLAYPWLSEAKQLRPFARELGLTDEQILTEEHSRNTYENALYSAEIIRQQGFQKLLLVTSAFHMRRSVGVFHRQGLYPDLYPVDFFSPLAAQRIRLSDFFPSAHMLSTTTLMVHELLGVAMYRVQGYY